MLLSFSQHSSFESRVTLVCWIFPSLFLSSLPNPVKTRLKHLRTDFVSCFLSQSYHIVSSVPWVLTRVSKGRDVPLSLCPGTKKISCPGVTLSHDKGRSKCPGTHSSVPARPGTKRFKNFQKKGPDFPFQNIISLFQNIVSYFKTSFSVLEHPFSVLERLFLLCPVLSRVPSRFQAVPARPGFWLSRPVLSLGKIFSLSRCPFVPGQ